MVLPGQAPVRTGDLLAGKYRVERVLGYGGMGVVVAARHEQLGQLVAIKFVRDETLEQADAVERFVREARAAVKLRSEHVARVLDVGVLESGAPYMVMEFLEGSDLGKLLTDDGPLPVDAAALMIMQACEAVAEAHSAGIVHRDLKPQNLFLTRTLGGSPRLKVLDFGVSKAMGLSSDPRAGLTRTRAMLGSPLYMAPEQMRSARDVDARVDIWALGVVLFELLTRRWPFEADSMPELCLKVVSEPPQSLAALRPDVPPGLVRIVERCLAKNPGDRFDNAGELAAALDPYAPAFVGRLGSRPSGPDFGRASHLPSRVSFDASRGLAPDLLTLPSASSNPQPAMTAVGATPAAWGSSNPSTTPSPAGAGLVGFQPAGGPAPSSAGQKPHRRVPAWAWLVLAMVALAVLGGGLALRGRAAPAEAVDVRSLNPGLPSDSHSSGAAAAGSPEGAVVASPGLSETVRLPPPAASGLLAESGAGTLKEADAVAAKAAAPPASPPTRGASNSAVRSPVPTGKTPVLDEDIPTLR